MSEARTGWVVPDTFADSWCRAVSSVGSQTFLVWLADDGGLHEWTYSEFDTVVRSVAAHLRELGVGRGDGVHVVLGNSPAFVATWLACVQLGAFLIPSDPRSTANELAATLARTRPALHISGGGAAGEQELIAAGIRVPCLRINESEPDLAGLRTDSEPVIAEAPSSTDIAALMFTSGTTSQPKGVLVTQANYAFAGRVMAAAAALRSDDRFLVCLPMFHANGQYYCFASAIHVGASIALTSRFSASRFMQQAERLAATHASLFAAPIRMILSRSAHAQQGRYRLRHVWFAQNLSADDYRRATQLFGCAPRQLYGMTETIAAVLTSHPLEASGDVIGRATLGCDVYVGHETTGKPLPAGEVGEILVGGRRGVELFAGYANDPDGTDRSFRDGWYRTGDLAWVDTSGRFHFAGRSGDKIKVSGENVSLASVEAVLAEHPAVEEVAVVGAPDPVLDEIPVAFIVLKPEHQPGAAQSSLDEWVARRLAPSQRPRKVVFVDELPHTSVGKIKKHELTRLMAAQD